jgi:hypothetical protein
MGSRSRISQFIRGPRAIIGDRSHMPDALPMRRKLYRTIILNPLPKGCLETGFGFFNYQTHEFVDSFGQAGTYDACTVTLTNSMGVKMTLKEFSAMPLKPRKTERICVGESVL